MPSPHQLRKLEQAKKASTLQLLFRASRLANERAMARVNAQAGRNVFRGAIANLVPHIDFEGVRISTLADKVGVTKQAVSKLVAEMVEEGWVELLPDPDDARARLVRYTARGTAAIAQGLEVLMALERELAGVVGERKMRDLQAILVALLAALEPSPDE